MGEHPNHFRRPMGFARPPPLGVALIEGLANFTSDVLLMALACVPAVGASRESDISPSSAIAVNRKYYL
ncbi:hypothetical protein PSACC_01750 [Paramicrosporidium saccamoebae]|uniref:Uncharacterized protein n=1 Tax=Paramicrosporidium saccamoebae TaxID=1246581 RepID=A0A2H9TKZ5_9FUNG|nr:hypothetical protein PSACC_01750 [Paramicrosporidium saccamoebae]